MAEISSPKKITMFQMQNPKRGFDFEDRMFSLDVRIKNCPAFRRNITDNNYEYPKFKHVLLIEYCI
jgi:hypothetical protein